jgi:hypothetical protein
MREADLRQILAALGINDVTEDNSSGWLHSSCPFAPWKHSKGTDTSKGFAIKIEDNGTSAFMCPACKSKGRIEKLARELGVLRESDYSELIQRITNIETGAMFMMPSWENRNIIYKQDTLPPPLDPIAFDPMEIFDDPMVGPAAHYLAQRGVSQTGAEKAGIRYDPDQKRLVFPVYDDKGDLYGMTGRSIVDGYHPKVRDYAGLPKKLLILGEHRWTKGRPIVLVEGLFAYARFLTENVDEDYNVGALLGSSVTEGKAARLRNWGVPIHLLLDPDKAGQEGMFGPLKKIGADKYTGEPIYEQDWSAGGIAKLIEHVPVYAPEYPHGVEDPDWLTRNDVRDMVHNGVPCIKPSDKKYHRFNS